MDWSDEKTEELRRMWLAGDSGSDIGRSLGTTRNAVIGKVHRLGLARDMVHHQHTSLPRKPRLRPRQPRPAVVWRPPPVTLMPAEVQSFERILARMAEDPPGRVHILEVTARQCRHIARDDSMCCGLDAVPGLPYCGIHAARCYQPATALRQPFVPRPQVKRRQFADAEND